MLLIAPGAMSAHAGGGVTMNNLFRGWPAEQIAQIYNYGERTRDDSVCQKFYKIPPLQRPLALLEGRPLFGAGFPSRVARRLNAGRWLGIDRSFQEAIQFARGFAPDVIYARPMDKPTSSWWFAAGTSRLLGIPYVTHIMDDWPARFHDDAAAPAEHLPWKSRITLRAQSNRLNRLLGRLVDNAAANIAISPEMAAAFGERYGRPFVAFHNTVDAATWKASRKAPLAGRPGHDRPFVVRYIGAVVKEKELDSLKDIARAVTAMSQTGVKVRFDIHCGPAWNQIVDEELVRSPSVARGDFLSQSDLPMKLSRADLLVLPINFDEVSTRYVGYSMQTKGPEYMASGTPILAYGPAANPNIRYARDARWAFVIDQRDESGSRIAQVISRLIAAPEIGDEVASRAWDTLRANHDAPLVREAFRKLLADAARRA